MIRASDDLVTVKEAAELLQCRPCTVRQLFKLGRLTPLRGLGRGYKILRSEIDAEIERQIAERKARGTAA